MEAITASKAQLEVDWLRLLGVLAAFALVALLGANWYSTDFDEPKIAGMASATVNGWTILHGADTWLVVLAGLAVTGLLVTTRESLAVAFAAALGATVIVIYHLISFPSYLSLVAGSSSVAIGLWLSLAAALVLTAAVTVELREEL